MTEEKKQELKKFMYWLSDYKGWEDVKTVVLLAEYEAHLKGQS